MPKIHQHLRQELTLDPRMIEEIADELRREELRGQSFSIIVKEAVARIDKLFLQVNAQKKLWRPGEVRLILDEFVFNTNRLVNAGTDNNVLRMLWELNPIRVLETAELLLRTISNHQDENDRQILFDTYFFNRYFKDEDVMLVILCWATQLAAGAQNSGFLKCCAMWMKEAGLDSFAVNYIAQEIVKELSRLDIIDKYSKLPEFAPEFAAHIVMAIAKVFRDKDRPEALVNQMATWIEHYPSVCFIPPHSSIFDLFRWSMFAVPPEPRLHAALLSALLRVGRGVPLQVIPHIMQIIQEFKVQRDHYCQTNRLSSLSRRYLRRKRRAEAGVDAEGATKSYEEQLSAVDTFKSQIDRLFQLIQMLTSTEILEENELQPIFQAYEGALEFRTNFYVQMKSMYGVLEEGEGQGFESDFPLKKQMHGKFNHQRKSSKKSVKHSSTTGPFSVCQLTEENESNYLDKSGEPLRYTIEDSDSSETEDDESSVKQNKFKSARSGSNMMDLSVNDMTGRNGRILK